MGRLVVLTIVFGTMSSSWAAADCGGIPFNPRATIFEPKQRAMIVFNGREEILLLRQDLKVSEATKVLQVLPLPSEPRVTKGDFEVFVKATELINQKLGRNWGVGGMGRIGAGSADKRAAQPPAGEVTFHDKIGSHDVSVVHVLEQRGFIDWVEKYLRKSGVGNPEIPEAMKDVVAEYLRDRFQWFVFDVVDAGTEVKTKEALQYRFATRSLYYPLRITRGEEGDTHVQLLILSPELVRLPHLGKTRIRVAHDPVDASPAEVRALGHEEVSDLVKGRHCKLRIWEVDGPLSGFTKDIIVRSAP